MSGARHRQPNRRLSWERLERGWSYEEAADQIKASMWMHGDVDTGLLPNTVRRWETGDRSPDPRYRKHLVLVFGKTASELGLLTPEELEMRPDDGYPADVARRLLTMANPAQADIEVNRALFLRGIVGAGLAPLASTLGVSAGAVEALGHAITRSMGPDGPAVAAYAEICVRQRELYWSTPAHLLLESALSHTQLGVQLLRGAGVGDLRRELARSVAESALLTARIAFFDLQQEAVAQRCFEVAREATQQADDHALAVAVYGHMSFVPGFNGDRAGAETCLAAAQAHARYASGPALRSWMHCVASEITARTGDPSASLGHVRQAEDSLTTSGADPEWLDFYDSSRLAGFTGYSLLVAGRPTEAAGRLAEALDELAASNTKQQAVLLFDLASAHAPQDAERAADYADRAFTALERDWYATAANRVPAVSRQLAGSPYETVVRERARALPGARPS
ncbi:transcriptional regulator with XRE-family HTH domain [Actinokineospora baliensis]|uniref:helix-turn-helix domain-containing protein n=1 Tax=Actinokineospora baliensis TaxID=547056 RepID=UPI0019599B2B|nr:helix-turn-helix transcriptional regulator [Actinokineospora baliensis]MBM7771761.1 transcriptional regulator with XRE-family HTH domain [Actinokineospora baliensis]